MTSLFEGQVMTDTVNFFLFILDGSYFSFLFFFFGLTPIMTFRNLDPVGTSALCSTVQEVASW